MSSWFDTIKAGEARSEYGGDGEGIVWAIVSAGIDETHSHFLRHKTLELPPPLRHVDFTNPNLSAELSEQEALTDLHDRGTLVGALIAGEDSNPKPATISVAPKAKLLSLKVLAETYEDTEMAILKALQDVMDRAGEPVTIHGLTLPLQMQANLQNYAVGASPVCAVINELVRRGVCVVTCAGNRGFDSAKQVGVPYSITDPGNAELAITVGSTHPKWPQQYGASYFSSRGPTLDGRAKPDLLAPGERIESAVPDRAQGDEETPPDESRGGTGVMDGTDMAAGIVSGACAAMLSAFPELIGNPLELKRLLMDSAEDLGRDRFSQGAGLLDLAAAMRAAGGKPASGRSPAAAPRAMPAPTEPVEAGSNAPPDNPEVHTIQGPADKRFAVAVSFAGDQRDYVTAVVRRLRRRGLKIDHIFFDEYWEAELARPDLDLYLQSIYENEAELLIPFFSRGYVDREWTGLEWRVLREVIKTKRADEIMPVILDNVKVPGSFSIDGALRGGAGIDPEEIGDKILRRLLSDRERRGRAGKRSPA